MTRAILAILAALLLWYILRRGDPEIVPDENEYGAWGV